MHRLWRKRGRRIRPNDKDLVFRTVFFLLLAVFAVTFVLLNIRTDWRSPSVAYLLFSAAMGVKVCTVTAWLLYRRYKLFSDVQRADDIEVVIDGAAGQKQFAYMEPVKLKNQSVTAEGYVINGRAFVDYILHAEDMEKA